MTETILTVIRSRCFGEYSIFEVMRKHVFLIGTFIFLFCTLHAQQVEHFLAKTNADFKVSNLSEIQATIGSTVGDIITIRIPKEQAPLLSNIEGLTYVQEATKIQPNIARAVVDLRADSVYMGHNLKQAYSGKDVIIGVTDWGFDYTHPMFYDTALQHTRILAAWDQFKRSGPAPEGYAYGTEYNGETELLAAEKDTFNIYEYGTHGTHVAGIAGGSGAGTIHRGVAFEANFLMATFLVNEAAVIDAITWMQKKAQEYEKRLVINMSWGLYNLGPLDGTSLVSQALDELSNQGVIFVTSGGNNGDVDFHIKKTFTNDTLRSQIEFYPYDAHPEMWGQNISLWGEENEDFDVGFSIYSTDKVLLKHSEMFATENAPSRVYRDSFLITGMDTVFYTITLYNSHPLNQKPHIQMRIRNTNNKLKIGLTAHATSGTVHCYNVVELNNDVGNWGLPFSALFPSWVDGDNAYGLGEPASTRSVITVAAHASEIRLPSGTIVGGAITSFSSIGPTVDERSKPDVSAPGLSIVSSISSFTNRSITPFVEVPFNGKDYAFTRFSGTSMSSPAVAGVVALMLEANPSLISDQAKDILKRTTREDNNTGSLPSEGSPIWGAGKVNAIAAVRISENSIPRIPWLPVNPTYILYPNPASAEIHYSSEEVQQVSVYSIHGDKVLTGEINYSTAVDVSSLVPGIYVLKFKDSDHEPISFIRTAN